MSLGNLILAVDEVDFPYCPSSYKIDKNDVSQPNAGRTEDAVMHKLMMGTCTKIGLAFQNIGTDVVRDILTRFTGEYHSVTYVDVEEGDPDYGYAVTKTFYLGDRSYELYNGAIDVWSSLEFNIIQRGIS